MKWVLSNAFCSSVSSRSSRPKVGLQLAAHRLLTSMRFDESRRQKEERCPTMDMLRSRYGFCSTIHSTSRSVVAGLDSGHMLPALRAPQSLRLARQFSGRSYKCVPLQPQTEDRVECRTKSSSWGLAVSVTGYAWQEVRSRYCGDRRKGTGLVGCVKKTLQRFDISRHTNELQLQHFCTLSRSCSTA